MVGRIRLAAAASAPERYFPVFRAAGHGGAAGTKDHFDPEEHAMKYSSLAPTLLVLSVFAPALDAVAGPDLRDNASVVAMGPMSAPLKPGGPPDGSRATSNCAPAYDNCANSVARHRLRHKRSLQR